MFTRKNKIILIVAAALLGCAAIFSFAPGNLNRVLVWPLISPQRANIEQINSADLGIVLGAGLNPNRTLSNVATERVNYAMQLYKAKPLSLMFSGGETPYGIEAVAMNAYAHQLGYKGLDHMEASSHSTYENAFYSDQLLDEKRFPDQTVLVITSPYHSRRALAVFRKVMPERTVLIAYPDDSVILQDTVLARWKGLYNITREYAANLWYKIRYGV